MSGAILSEREAIEAEVAREMHVSCAYNASSGADEKRNAGSYPITVDSSNGYDNANCYKNTNYAITFADGTLKVKKRVVYYQANDVSISYGKENPPASFTGAFVADDAEDRYDGWCYGEGITDANGCTAVTSPIDVYSDEGCTATTTFSNERNFNCYESSEADAAQVSSTTPAGKYVINPADVEGNIFAKNYEFKHKPGILTIQKYYITIQNVEVLGKIYDGTKNVDEAHLLKQAKTINGYPYDGLKFTYYEGANWIEGQTETQLRSKGDEYVNNFLSSLVITAEYRSAEVSDSSMVNVSISIKPGSYLDKRYELLTADNYAQATESDPTKYSNDDVTKKNRITQTETEAFIIGAGGERKPGGIQKRPLTLYPEDKTIKYGETISVVTSAPGSGQYTLVKDRKPEETATGDEKEIGFAAGESFTTIGFTPQSRIYRTALTDGRPGMYENESSTPLYQAGSDVGYYGMDISEAAGSSCNPNPPKNYEVSYDRGLLTVSQNTFPAPETVAWDEDNPGTITWSRVEKIGNVEVARYRVDLYKDGEKVGGSRYTTDANALSMDLLETMREAGAGAYTVKICAEASKDYNKVGDTEYANVAQFGREKTSAIQYAAAVTVAFSTDATTVAAKANSESAKIYAEAVGEATATETYVMIAGESGKHISYSWSRMGVGSDSTTICTSGYTVDSVMVSRGESDLAAGLFTLGENTGNVDNGTYQSTFGLSRNLDSKDPITVTLKLKAKSAAVTLTVKETHDPAIETTMYGYKDEGRPGYEAYPAATEENDGEYDYTYKWSFKKLKTYDATNPPQDSGSETIDWSSKNFLFPLGQTYFNQAYTIYCEVTATRRDNGQTAYAKAQTSLKITRAKAENSVTVNVEGNGWKYGDSRYRTDGTPKIKVVKTIEEVGQVTLQYRTKIAADADAENDEDNWSAWSDKAPTDAGIYQVRANVAESDNYEGFDTNPVDYEIKQAKLAAPQNIIMTNSATAPYGLVKWDEVTGPKENAGKEDDSKSHVNVKYEVKLSRTDMDAAENAGQTVITTVTTTDVSYDFSDLITEAGKYYVTVQALVDPRPVKEDGEADSDDRQSYDGQDVNNCADSEVSTFTALITIGAEIRGSGNGVEATENGFAKIYDGTDLTLTANYSSGTGNNLYQWMKNGVAIGGATTDNTLSIRYVEDNASYACKIYPNGSSTQEQDIIYTKNVKAEITPRPIKITADSPQKEYDSMPLTADPTEWTVVYNGQVADGAQQPAGLAAGDAISYSGTLSSRTNAGESTNKVTSVKITTSREGAEKTVYTDDSQDSSYANKNYSITKVDGKLAVTARPLGDGTSYTTGISVDDIPSVSYNGIPQKPDQTGADGQTDQVIVKDRLPDADNTPIEVKLSKDTDYTVSYENNTNAGTATVKITGKGNYSDTITKTFEIEKRVAVPVWGQSDFVYDASEKTITAAIGNKVGNDDVAFTYADNAATNAGSYTAEITGLTGNAKENYTIEGAAGLSKEWSIGKAPGEVNITSDVSKVYDGTPVTDPTTEYKGTGGVTFAYYTKNTNGNYETVSEDKVAANGRPLHAGTYYVQATVAEDPNYQEAKSAYTEVTISKRKVTITPENKTSKYREPIAQMTYEITASSDVLTDVAPNPLVHENDLGVVRAYAKESDAGNASEISTTTKAGDYTIQISYTENPDYDVTAKTATYKITSNQQELSVSDVTAIYDGTAHEIIFDHTAGSSNHPVGDGDVTITYQKTKDADGNNVSAGAATCDLLAGKPVHAGTYKAVITAAETDNYDAKTVEATVTIGKRALALQVESDSQVYNTTALTKPSYKLANGSTLATDDTITIEAYTGTITDVLYDENQNVISVENSVDEEDIVITNSNTDIGTVTTDYDIGVTSGTLKVLPRGKDEGAQFVASLSAPQGITMSGTGIYNWAGSEIAPVITITDESLNGTTDENKAANGKLILQAGRDYTLSGTTKAQAAGDYTAVVTFKGNFKGSLEIAWSIKDVTPPTGKIGVATTWYESLLEAITFGLFFKAGQTVTIEATEEIGGSGIASLSYCKVDGPADALGAVSENTIAMTASQLTDLPEENWTNVTDDSTTHKTNVGAADQQEKWSYSFTLSPDWKGVLYARIRDKSGHTTYVSSDGLILEDEVPVISNVAQDKTYCIEREVTVTDVYLKKVTLQKMKDAVADGAAATPDGDAQEQTVTDGRSSFTLYSYDEGTYTITATDKAGNETTVSGIRVNSKHTWTYAGSGTKKVTATCAQESCNEYHTAEGLTVEISAQDVPYTGSAHMATVTKSDTFRDANAGTVGDITYYKVQTKGACSGGTPVENAIDAGHYYAQASVTSHTGEVAYVRCAFEIKMVEVVFDYNEGNDHTNVVENITTRKIVRNHFGASVSAEEIAAVAEGVTREHYVFEGWYDAPEGGSQVTAISALDESVTLYAHWRELVAPVGSIKVKNSIWTSFLNTITFGHFFKETQNVVIDAQDNGMSGGEQTHVTNSGMQEIAYYVQKGTLDEVLAPLSQEAVTNLPQADWRVYDRPFAISPEAKYVIYARLTDNAGNVSYLSSDGLYFEATPPVISGAESGGIYCLSRTVTVSDTQLDAVRVTLSDGSVFAEETGLVQTGKQITLPGRSDGKSYTVTATDKAGNETVLQDVTVREKHTWKYEMTAQSKLMATCEVAACDTYHETEELTVQISAQTATYDTKQHRATVSASEAFEAAGAGEISEITYYSAEESGRLAGGTLLAAPPADAGNYYAAVTVRAENGAQETLVCSYEITPVSLERMTLANTQMTYHGRRLENPETITAVVDGVERVLVKERDYVVTSSNDENAGQASVRANGTGNFTGTLETNYEIIPAKITVSANDATSGYGNPMAEIGSRVVEGEIFEGDDLQLGAETDATAKSPFGTYEIRPTYEPDPNYEVTTANGVYTITRGVLAVETDGYEGVYDSREHGITMKLADEEEACEIYYSIVPLTADNYRQAGSTTMPTFADIGEYTVYYYVISDHYAPLAGSDQVIITERSVAEAEQSENFTISVGDIPDTVYDGAAKEPDPGIIAHYTLTDHGTVTERDVTLRKDVDYVLSYENNVAAGTATVTIRGIGNYDKVMTKTFRILPREVQLEWSQDTFEYDGSEKCVTATVINKAAASDDVAVGTYEANKNTKAGNYTAEALSLTGKDAQNYCIGEESNAQWKWSIVQKQDTSGDEVEEELGDGEGDEAGSTFGLLKAKSVKQTKTTVTVSWTRMTGADGYLIYGSRCNSPGHSYRMKLLKTVKNPKTTKWTQKKLKAGTYYKYCVKAYKLVNGKKEIIATSVGVHSVTKGGKYGVAKSVTVKSVGGKKTTKITLGKGKSAKIKAVEVKADKPISHHRDLKYESSNTKIATVSQKGKITAKGKGTCKIWVYAQNGVYKTITVTVK